MGGGCGKRLRGRSRNGFSQVADVTPGLLLGVERGEGQLGETDDFRALGHGSFQVRQAFLHVDVPIRGCRLLDESDLHESTSLALGAMTQASASWRRLGIHRGPRCTRTSSGDFLLMSGTWHPSAGRPTGMSM